MLKRCLILTLCQISLFTGFSFADSCGVDLDSEKLENICQAAGDKPRTYVTGDYRFVCKVTQQKIEFSQNFLNPVDELKAVSQKIASISSTDKFWTANGGMDKSKLLTHEQYNQRYRKVEIDQWIHNMYCQSWFTDSASQVFRNDVRNKVEEFKKVGSTFVYYNADKGIVALYFYDPVEKEIFALKGIEEDKSTP